VRGHRPTGLVYLIGRYYDVRRRAIGEGLSSRARARDFGVVLEGSATNTSRHIEAMQRVVELVRRSRLS